MTLYILTFLSFLLARKNVFYIYYFYNIYKNVFSFKRNVILCSLIREVVFPFSFLLKVTFCDFVFLYNNYMLLIVCRVTFFYASSHYVLFLKRKHFSVSLLCSFRWMESRYCLFVLTYLVMFFMFYSNTHTHILLYVAFFYFLFTFYFINVIALSKQLVHFLMVWKPSEVVFASKSSFYPAIHWDLSDIIIFFFSFYFSHSLFIKKECKHTNVYFYCFSYSRCIVCYYPLPS